MLRPSEDVIIPSANFAVSVFFESALPRLNLLHDKCIKGTCQESSRYWEFAVSVENWEQGKEQEERWSFWHFKAQKGPRSEEYNLLVELATKISCLEFDGHVINTLFRTRQIWIFGQSFTELAFCSVSCYDNPRWESESISKHFRKEKKPTKSIRQTKSNDKLCLWTACNWAAVKVAGVECTAIEMNSIHTKERQEKALFFFSECTS